MCPKGFVTQNNLLSITPLINKAISGFPAGGEKFVNFIHRHGVGKKEIALSIFMNLCLAQCKNSLNWTNLNNFFYPPVTAGTRMILGYLTILTFQKSVSQDEC